MKTLFYFIKSGCSVFSLPCPLLCSSETSTPSLLLLCLHRLHDGPSTQPARASSSPSVTPSAVPMRSQSSGYRAVSCCVPRRPQVRESAYAMVALPERHSQRCATALIARGRSGTGVARGAVLKYGRLAGRLRGHRGGRDRALAWPSAIAIHRDRSCAATLARQLSHRGHCAAMSIVMATAW